MTTPRLQLLRARGYVTAPLLGPSELDSLRSMVAELDLDEEHRFYSSQVHGTRDQAAELDRRLTDVLWPLLSDLLPGHSPFLAAVISKGARWGDRVEFHQDWTYTDERHHRAVIAWVPLTDTDIDNGALAVLPGSHRWTDGVRAAGMPSPGVTVQQAASEGCVILPTAAGTAILYDPALLHGSGPNTTHTERAAVAIACAPSGAALVHFHAEQDGSVSGHAVDRSYFTVAEFASRPVGAAPKEAWAGPVDDAALLAGLDDVGGKATAREEQCHNTDMTAIAHPSAVVLRDTRLNRRLLRDGFVKFRLVDEQHAASLRDEFVRLQGGSGSGFHSDLVQTDTDYRRQTDATIGAALDHSVMTRFNGYQPFLHNFLCKFPGEDSDLYLHRDWMYVDESAGDRSYVVWVALEDIDGQNGQLQVLRSSHRIDGSLRGTNLIAPWLAYEDIIRERLLWVPVKAGECVVFDNSLVHCSQPNRTGDPRVVAAVGMRPMGSNLVHFRRSTSTAAVQYDVDESFFLTATPQGLLNEPPDASVGCDHLITESTITADELKKRLDRGALNRLDRAAKRRVTLAQSATHMAKAATATARRRVSVATRGLRSSAPTAAQAGAAARHLRTEVPTHAAKLLLGSNEAIIGRFGPDQPVVWDPAQFPWAKQVERAYPQIRGEVEALLVGPTEIPHIEDVTGGIPQGNEGPWRTFMMMHQGHWIDWNCQRCPATTAVVKNIPGLTVAGFSVLEAGTHITEHRGPNKGALRYQLGVIVPGTPGDCRIRVGDEMLVWSEGESVMFDFTVPHEAWNDSGGTRVLLMLEVITPLPWYLDVPNRLAQNAMSWFPTTRNVTERLRRLEPDLRKPDEDATVGAR